MRKSKNDIMSLNWRTCRFILNDDTSRPKYCCEIVTRRPYCEKHARICYIPSKGAKNAHQLD